MPAWSGPELPTSSASLSEGSLVGVVRLSAIPRSWRPAMFDTVDPNEPLSFTLGRRSDGGLHHRAVWTGRPGTSWRDVVPRGRACLAFGSAECLAYPDALAAVRVHGSRIRVDVWEGPGDRRAALERARAVHGGDRLDLRGHAVARARPSLWQSQPAAIDHARIEFTSMTAALRLRIHWRLVEAFESKSSRAPAPSWDALCTNAVACFRTGPWPDLGRWLRSLPDAAPQLEHETEFLHLVSGTWPHALAHQLHQARERLPPGARGYFDTALSGLGTVEFAGGRVDTDGSVLAFARAPATWVNFAAAVLAYAGHPSAPVRLSSERLVSWVALPSGGLVFALDDGQDPENGWIAFCSSPDGFDWIASAHQTAAGPIGVALQLREGAIDRLPDPLRSWMDPLTGHIVTARIDVDGPTIGLEVLAERAQP